MIVFNRSNDIIFGCYGANAVHFSFLQEYIACCCGLSLGTYTQLSSDFHAYKNVLEQKVDNNSVSDETVTADLNLANPLVWIPMIKPATQETQDHLDNDIKLAVEPFTDVEGRSYNHREYRTSFGYNVLLPMRRAFYAYKFEGRDEALAVLSTKDKSIDWLYAASAWLSRRKSK
jgi:hypothetical protein